MNGIEFEKHVPGLQSVAMATLTPGSSVPQKWDHLDERNLALLANYAEELAGPANTPFPLGGGRVGS